MDSKNQPTKIGDLDLEKQYEKYRHVLKGVKDGEIVTRFPPEPSGYLHIGHVKAAMINYHYAKMYKGKMLLRFDDTNPTKEKEEFVDSIIADLNTLGITYDKLSYTSDYFDYFMEAMTKLIKEGKCYCDNTPVEQMRLERGEGIESKNRQNTVEQNLEIWKKMIAGEVKDYCVRPKWNMQSLNKCMRDPVFYRSNENKHHRTGDKYKVYPTYDFACPIIDSIEGVTHAMRTNEYSDRIELYHKVNEMTGHRQVTIYEFSRLNFVRTVLSKRKLNNFVDQKKVEGWDDPRFPTVRGIVRRGIQIETLVDFMLEQGPSKRTNLQEWDKFWATNQKYIDPKAARYTAISKENVCTLTLNGDKYSSEPQVFQVPLHPKNANMGNRPQFRTNVVYVEFEDAKLLKVDQKITLMKWGNCIIKSIEKDGNALKLTADLAEDDHDYKSTMKINWLPKCDLLVDVDLVEYDHLITVDKIDEEALEKEGKKFEDIVNKKSKFSTSAFADPNVKNLQKATVIQFERRGYFIVDKIHSQADGERKVELVYIPDGKTKTMSNLSTKVDQAENVGAKKDDKKKKKGGDKKEETKEEAKDAEPSPADFHKLDVRIGKIKEVWKHAESDKLYCEKIDIGKEVREIGSGLQQFVTQEEMTQDLVCVLANLKMRKLAGFPSTGMVLCASNADHTQVELLRPPTDSKVGERVVVEGYEDKISQEMEKVVDPKKKILEKLLPLLKADAEGYATFMGAKLKTSAGYLKAKTLKDCQIS
eukprot:CAMPEP_0114594314 /NCGR_PEP_ID=MMETSP0125-20121206/15956_1 /TAXON_ID=485358 ORGANISM="Aristerostoma sp., Strain ATCC 50986" /NCGR_SAMPLE_ID=MMETSP0125 /ASSEMBLY_ACC=CAM_ASM_000245 /LENGTH=756 /DNA_ID=CAMNT_0001794465 /DNA_START=70 /DNA_END=2340 /DNA_ORIENTATION=+